jgi:uncharacterized protein YkwD
MRSKKPDILYEDITLKTSDPDYDLEMRNLINAERKRRGLSPLSKHSALIKAAQAHSDDMAKNNYFNHFSRDGKTWADRARIANYPGANLMTIGEDIGMGQTGVPQLFKDFCNSPGHLRPIIDPKNEHCGLGYANGKNGIYWTLSFGRGGGEDLDDEAFDRDFFNFI